MADDLDDEWWLTAKEQTEKENEKEQEYELKSNDRKKRSCKTDQVLLDDGQTKKKRKKQKKDKEQEFKEETAGTWEDVVGVLCNHFKGEIPATEFEDLVLSEEHFLQNNEDLNDLSTYLSFTIRKWKKLCAADLKPKSPILLVVSSAAKRAVDLNREAKDFTGKCSSAKLFAKHMKITKQIKFLSRNKVHFAVGTPNRISSLIDHDALDITGVKYLILDWNYRDLKKRRMADIPEIKKDLLNFIKDNVVPAILNGNRLKIGIF